MGTDTLLRLTITDGAGIALGKREVAEGVREQVFGLVSRDTDELVATTTIREARKRGQWHLADALGSWQRYWERRYAARRFARRLGALPTYADLYESHIRLKVAAGNVLLQAASGEKQIPEATTSQLADALEGSVNTMERV